MKLVIVILCLLPIVLAEKRSIIDNFFNVAEIKNVVNAVIGKFGTDATEQQCEQECLLLFTNDLLDRACDFLCLEFQSLVKKFYHAPPSTPSA